MAVQYQDSQLNPDDFTVVKVPVNRIEALWDHVEPHLRTGLRVAPELKFRTVLEGLNDESIQLWVVTDGYDVIAAFLTSIERDRMDWVVSLYALGGAHARYWLDQCDEAMEDFARDEGAVRVRMCGRKAWQRLLPKTFTITGVRGGHNVYERAVQ